MMRIGIPRFAYGVALVCCGWGSVGQADEPEENAKGLKQPVYRVSKNIDDRAVDREKPAGHPIDAALKMAHDALHHIQHNVVDYTATLVKRETVNGQLLEPEYMEIKVRNRKINHGVTVVPLSVYIKYLRPRAKKGQEAIWVEGRNNNKIVGHGAGLQGLFTVYLEPDGFFATRGTNYAIYDLGIENLIHKLIERGGRTRNQLDCQVQFFRNAKINGRACTLIQVTQPVQRPELDFHIARIFIDDEIQLPVRYEAHSWPETPQAQPGLIEEFTYINLNLNVGLTDADFDHENPNYSYP